LITSIALIGLLGAVGCGKKAPAEPEGVSSDVPDNEPPGPNPAKPPGKTGPGKNATVDLLPHGIIGVIDLPEGCTYETKSDLKIGGWNKFQLALDIRSAPGSPDEAKERLRIRSAPAALDEAKERLRKEGRWKFLVDAPDGYFAESASATSFRMRHDLVIGDRVVSATAGERAVLTRAEADRLWESVRSLRQTEEQRNATAARQRAAARIKELGGAVGELRLGGTSAELRGDAATDEGAELLRGVPDLKEVAVRAGLKKAKLTRAGMKTLSELRTVRGLDLSGEWLTDAKFDGLGPLPGLQTLRLEDTSVTDTGLAVLERAPNLVELILRAPQRPYTDAGLKHLAPLTRLTLLHVPGSQATDATMACLAGMPDLAALVLDGARVTDAGLAHLANKPRLSHLSLRETGVRGAGLAHLAASEGLMRLDLDWSSLTDEGLVSARGLTTRSIHLEGTLVGDAGAAHLADVNGLSEVFLASTRITDAGVALVARPELRVLDLSWTAVTGNGVKTLNGCKRLETLDLRGTDVQDDALVTLAALPVLRKLDLAHTDLSDAGLKALEAVPADRDLKVYNDQWLFSRAAIDALARARPRITFSIMPPADPGARDVTPPPAPTRLPKADPSALFEKLGIQPEVDEAAPGKPIVGVGVRDGKCTDADLAHLRELKTLKHLFISGPVTDVGLAHLAALPALETLTVASEKVTDAGLGHLAGLVSLRELDLRGTKLSGDGLVHLKALKNLQRLELSPGTLGVYLPRHVAPLEGLRELEVLRLGNQETEAAPHAVKLYAGLPNLKELELWFAAPRTVARLGTASVQGLKILGTPLTPRGFETVARIKGLKRLQLFDHVDDRGLAALAPLTGLEELDLLDARGVTDAGAPTLASFQRLTRLGVRKSRLTGAGAAQLAGLVRLEHLVLDESHIGDDIARLSARLPRLDSLSFNRTALTDAGLAALGEIKNLQSLTVHGTLVTTAGLRKLKSARPDLSLYPNTPEKEDDR
jgi:hypothetical protein